MHRHPARRRTLIRPALLGILALTAACSSHKTFYTVTTPLGQTLGRTTSEDAAKVSLRAWFNRVDTNQDGKLSREEFQAEADAVFTHYDLNGDGALNVTELEKVRRADRMALMGHGGPEGGPHGEPGGGGPGDAPGAGPEGASPDAPPGGGRGRGGMGGGIGGGGRGGVDPIMAADTNLDFRVTRDEFRAYARALFEVIDANHDGQLTIEEIEKVDLTVQEPGGGGRGGPGGGMGGGGRHGGGRGGMGGGGPGGM
ncbi:MULTISPECIES: EF-hand domain-containing protein [Nitrospirillum]|uniref:EF hand domain-containing protein n=1 Tax=Nitrospirillum amazonense TaxID=28077 RepID=A0A560G130_9PROT|nr:EF-hand domain-containing protein [Nitrospirillum amazonense]MEC4589634.1 EF-hand domain-containing protein [Nitrospirillum amazonense]TWB27552.1 EF hand domain-containing protein [Nitrospirillum amazonense]